MQDEASRSARSAGVWMLLFAVALLLRVGVALWLPQEVVWADGSRYEQVALNLLGGEGFGSFADNARSVPTQPLLIAAVYAVFGQSYLALRLFFAVLGAVSCVLGGLLGARLFGRRAGILACVALCFYPYLVYLSALFEYPQTFFILVMALFFLLYYKFRDTGSKRLLFLAALCLGLAVLSVPTTLIFAAAFGLLLIARDWRETASRLAVCALAACLTVGAWSVRNYVAYDRPMLVNAAGGGAFWLGNNDAYWEHGKAAVVPACAPGYERTVYCQQYRAMWDYLEGAGLSDVERISELERISWQRGMEFVREHPGRFVMLSLRKFVDIWRPTPDAVNEGRARGGQWRDVIATLSFVPVLLLALYAVVTTASRWRLLLPIYAFVVTFIAPYTIFFPTTRYRLPIDFLLIVFAGAAAARFWTLWDVDRRLRAAIDAFNRRSVRRVPGGESAQV